MGGAKADRDWATEAYHECFVGTGKLTFRCKRAKSGVSEAALAQPPAANGAAARAVISLLNLARVLRHAQAHTDIPSATPACRPQLAISDKTCGRPW